jgi:predicted RNA polymerase sigma factor
VNADGLDSTGENLLRELAPQVLGAVVRRFGDFSKAEDAVQEALLAAAVQWPDEGVPDNPRGWLIHVAVRRMTDQLRAELARRRRETSVVTEAPPEQQMAPAPELPALHGLGSTPTGGAADVADQDDTLILPSCAAIQLTRPPRSP